LKRFWPTPTPTPTRRTASRRLEEDLIADLHQGLANADPGEHRMTAALWPMLPDGKWVETADAFRCAIRRTAE
jgi:hypothetical protein